MDKQQQQDFLERRTRTLFREARRKGIEGGKAAGFVAGCVTAELEHQLGAAAAQSVLALMIEWLGDSSRADRAGDAIQVH